jgi:hypothetical protein
LSLFESSEEAEEATEIPAPAVAGSSTRGLILHKLMEELLTGELQGGVSEIDGGRWSYWANWTLTRKNRLVYFVLAKGCLVPFEAEAPQPTSEVHDGAPNLARANNHPDETRRVTQRAAAAPAA